MVTQLFNLSPFVMIQIIYSKLDQDIPNVGYQIFDITPTQEIMKLNSEDGTR